MRVVISDCKKSLCAPRQIVTELAGTYVNHCNVIDRDDLLYSCYCSYETFSRRFSRRLLPDLTRPDPWPDRFRSPKVTARVEYFGRFRQRRVFKLGIFRIISRWLRVKFYLDRRQSVTTTIIFTTLGAIVHTPYSCDLVVFSVINNLFINSTRFSPAPSNYVYYRRYVFNRSTVRTSNNWRRPSGERFRF